MSEDPGSTIERADIVNGFPQTDPNSTLLTSRLAVDTLLDNIISRNLCGQLEARITNWASPFLIDLRVFFAPTETVPSLIAVLKDLAISSSIFASEFILCSFLRLTERRQFRVE